MIEIKPWKRVKITEKSHPSLSFGFFKFTLVRSKLRDSVFIRHYSSLPTFWSQNLKHLKAAPICQHPFPAAAHQFTSITDKSIVYKIQCTKLLKKLSVGNLPILERLIHRHPQAVTPRSNLYTSITHLTKVWPFHLWDKRFGNV